MLIMGQNSIFLKLNYSPIMLIASTLFYSNYTRIALAKLNLIQIIN
jgi:hypothetical protein